MWSRLNVKNSHIHEQSSPGIICLQESRLSSRSSRPQGRSTRFPYSWMRNSFRFENALLTNPSTVCKQIYHLEHADHHRPSWPPSPSQRWSEPRWWEGQALHSPSSSKPPQFRLKLLSLLRLTWIAILNKINICTNCTPSNGTKYLIRKIWNLFIYITFQTGQTIQLQGGQQVKEPNTSWRQLDLWRTLLSLCSCQDNFFNMVIFRCTSNNRTDFTPPHPNFPMPHSMYKYQEQ